MLAELSSDERTALLYLVMAVVVALGFLVLVGVDSARSSPVFRRLGVWLKRKEGRRSPEASEQFRAVAAWKARSEKLGRKRS